MKTFITIICIGLTTILWGQEEKKTNTSLVRPLHNNLNTEIQALDLESEMYRSFAELIGIIDDELLELEELVIYPNPNDGHFKIRYIENEGRKVNVMVYDITGKVVYEASPEIAEREQRLDVDISQKPPGNYFLVIRRNDASQTRRIQKL